MRSIVLFVLLATVVPAQAQEVRRVPDVISWGTAAVNPTLAAIDAWRAPDRACRLTKLIILEGIGNGLSLTLKHLIASPRPCAGCAPDGFPSGHTVNSAIGLSRNWYLGGAISIGATASLRVAAHRHTWKQVAAGAAIGLGADAAGHLMKCQS